LFIPGARIGQATRRLEDFMLIPKRLFAISALASKDATRINLAAVFAEREPDERPRLTATNGHVLVTVTWTEPDHEQFANIPDMRLEAAQGFTALIPATAWHEASKNLAGARNGLAFATHALLEENGSGDRLRLTSTDGETHRTITTRCPEESFPDYRALWPDPDRVVVHIGLSAELVANLLTTIDSMAGRHTGIEFLVPADPSLPVELRARGDNDEEIRALCMPMRLGRTSATDERGQELRVLLSQLDRIVSLEDFGHRDDLLELLKNALPRLTARLTQAMASRQMTCERCQRPATAIGDCGYCHGCCRNWCTHQECDCFSNVPAD
jgi:hypothetical protein